MRNSKNTENYQHRLIVSKKKQKKKHIWRTKTKNRTERLNIFINNRKMLLWVDHKTTRFTSVLLICLQQLGIKTNNTWTDCGFSPEVVLTHFNHPLPHNTWEGQHLNWPWISVEGQLRHTEGRLNTLWAGTDLASVRLITRIRRDRDKSSVFTDGWIREEVTGSTAALLHMGRGLLLEVIVQKNKKTKIKKKPRCCSSF